jgi:hypothetical protein
MPFTFNDDLDLLMTAPSTLLYTFTLLSVLCLCILDLIPLSWQASGGLAALLLFRVSCVML